MVDRLTQQQNLSDEAIRLLTEEYESATDFNAYFDSDELIQIGTLEFTRSYALFWLDREAYYNELEAWRGRFLVEQHQEAYRHLLTNGLLAPFRDLCTAIRSDRIVPIIGAGLSKSMDMPLWGEAMRAMHQRIFDPLNPSVGTMIDKGDYLAAAEILANENAPVFENYIRTTYRVQRIEGAVDLLPKISNGCIVTTNLDDAIEQVFTRDGISFDGYMHGTQQHNFFPRLVRGQRCLLKLHGDADDPQTYILKQTQYESAYSNPFDFHLPLPKALRQIYISSSLLFVGCSLLQDWTLSLFKYVKKQNEFEIPNHYALLALPSDLTQKSEQATLLLELNIQPIWYPEDDHKFVAKFLSLAIAVADKRVSLETMGVAA